MESTTTIGREILIKPMTINVAENVHLMDCVWEMAILWHERNAWVKHVLMKNENPDFEGYLNEQLNQDI